MIAHHRAMVASEADSAKGDGWVNWSGSATILLNVCAELNALIDRLMKTASANQPPRKPHRDWRSR